MSTPSQPTPPPAGDGPGAATSSTQIELPFEERLRVFWEKYRGPILGACLVVLLVIVGRSGWEILQERRAAALREEYAAAQGAEQLRQFAAENAGAPLAGVAELRVADEAYTAGRYSEAANAYDTAAESLSGTVLAGRARLGAALSRLKAGDATARTALEAVANDVNSPKALRAEAAYHLASDAAGAGRTEDVTRFVELVNAIDSNSLWAQRAMMLRPPAAETTPAPAAEATPPTEGEPAVRFPGQTP